MLRVLHVPAPRNLGRLPKHYTGEVAGEADDIPALVDAAEGELRGWRKVTRREGSGTEISAEKGYLREFGNIVFHFSLLGLLVAIAAGKMFSYEGNVIVVADGGPGFCSASPAAFDSFRAGNTVDGTSLYPMCVRVNDFQATYLESGQAVSYQADIEYQAGDDLASGGWRPYLLKVNEPLRVGGDRVYLQGHGYAPTFTVTFPDGQTRTQTLQWRPEDQITMLSSGAMRFDPPGGTYTDEWQRRQNQIAIQGLFAPTEQLDGTLGAEIDDETMRECLGKTLQAGNKLVAAGYSLYSASTELVLSLAKGTVAMGFTFDPSRREFVLSRRAIECPSRGPYYSLNDAREPDWPDGLKRWVSDAKRGATQGIRQIPCLHQICHLSL